MYLNKYSFVFAMSNVNGVRGQILAVLLCSILQIVMNNIKNVS